ncbi:hypothetical protein HKX48_008957 [Thoreauomyces humboldtii]|nr:hypothetical protein HKX48_008957 [Thoreauomyces humboldtii]
MFGGSFGQQPQQQAATGFGARPPQAAGGFGGFGGFGATSQPPASAPAFGGFGTSQPAAAPSGFGGFGTSQPAAAAPTGFGGFGTSQPAAAPTGFGGFGATASQPQQQQTSLFGAPAAQPGGFGGFGATTQAAAPGGLFGAQAKPGTTSLFGAPATSAAPFSFGGAQAGTSLFGSTAAAPTAGGMFGGQATFGGGFGQPQVQQQQQQQAPPQLVTVADHLQEMAAMWNPDNPRCQFKHYFYNIVHPSEVQSYGPQPTEDFRLYQQAQRDNPDPKCMVPVEAVGFRDIKKRVDMQDMAYRAHKDKLEEMRTKLIELQRTHFLETSAKLEEYKRRQAALIAKTLKLMTKVQKIRNRGYSVRAEEEKFKTRLEGMERDLQKPSVFRGRLNEIWAHLQQNKSSKQFSLTGGVDASYNISDEEQLGLMLQTLTGHQNGLAVLTEVAQQDTKIAGDVLRGYEEAGFRRR